MQNLCVINFFMCEKKWANFPACRGDPRDSTKFLVKLLNKLPPHHLYIKKGMVPMLLRSLAPKQILCNSEKIILNKVTDIYRYCKIASEDNAREEVLISRIEIKHQNDTSIEWNQCQFPFRSVFTMTINKTEGQTQKSGSLARGVYIYSWAALCSGLKDRTP